MIEQAVSSGRGQTKARYVGRDEGRGSTGGRKRKRSEGAHEEAKAEPGTDDKGRESRAVVE